MNKFYLLVIVIMLSFPLVTASYFDYNPQTGMCEADPLAFILCRTNYSLNPISGYCENGDLKEPIISDVNKICSELKGILRDNSIGNKVCVFNPVGVEKVLVTEWETEYIYTNVTNTILKPQIIYKLDTNLLIFIGIIFVVIIGAILMIRRK